MKIRVLEVDQWTSTGNVKNFDFEDFDAGKVSGGDSEAIRSLGLARVRIREVDENDSPGDACVWYVKGPDGKPKFWKANYDSSG